MLWTEAGLVLLSVLMAHIVPSIGSGRFTQIERPLTRFGAPARIGYLHIGSGCTRLACPRLSDSAHSLPIQHRRIRLSIIRRPVCTRPPCEPYPSVVGTCEGPNVIQQSTYSSMYYPAQGAFMALGQIIGKHPFLGSVAECLMCGAICWMLRAWVSPQWALIGGSWTWSSQWDQLLVRKGIQERLQALPGEHLVIVRYSPQHNPKDQWCSNSADIDSSKIVWANDMGATQNEELVRYFSKRHAWLVEPDRTAVELEAYHGANESGDRTPNESR